MHLLAQKRGGACLSNAYVNDRTHLTWQCSEGHQWTARPTNIQIGRWCPVCNCHPRRTLDQMKRLAVERGGLCLSTSYDASTMQWQCSEGHTWSIDTGSIVNGSWCPTCRLAKSHSIEKMRVIAKERDGLCLSQTYSSARKLLRWACKHGHEWSATPDSILRGSWCPHCAGCVRLSLKVYQDKAVELGGTCLSSTYKNNRTKLRWQCRDGHEWEARPDHILEGHWCPTCQNKQGEVFCRTWLERAFSKPFPQVWPEWLRSGRGRKLQLDGFNEELGLAFEYQGSQHYRYLDWFHKSPEDFEKQKLRDAEKLAVCLDRGVLVLLVPYNAWPVGSFMKKQLELWGFDVQGVGE